jgi:hypothetical protein
MKQHTMLNAVASWCVTGPVVHLEALVIGFKFMGAPGWYRTNGGADTTFVEDLGKGIYRAHVWRESDPRDTMQWALGQPDRQMNDGAKANDA